MTNMKEQEPVLVPDQTICISLKIIRVILIVMSTGDKSIS